MTTNTLSAVGEIVRRYDPDRFLISLFAPPARREALWTLYAFNHELARAREVTREPMIALIRLQWWREVVEGVDKPHEVATPLTRLLRQGLLDPADLLAMIAAREAETEETMPTRAAFAAYLAGSAGRLAVAAGRLLGRADARLVPGGVAFGTAGVLRSVARLARQGRCLLPADALAEHAMTHYDVLAGRAADAVLAMLAREALAAMPVAGAGLEAVLARRDLRRIAARRAVAVRGIGDKLAVLAAALRQA